MARSRDVINADPYKSMPKAPTGLSRPGERDVNDYQPPTRVKTPYDPKGVGLHGTVRPCGMQGPQAYPAAAGGRGSSGAPGLGGDSIRPAGQQGKR